MRLFGRTETDDNAPDPKDSNLDPNAVQPDPDGDGGGEPDPGYQPVSLTEDQLRTADLDTIYFEDGTPRYELDDGTPCDSEGNIIPANRPDFGAPSPIPTTEPAAPALTSPFAQGFGTEQQRQAWASRLGGEEQVSVVAEMAYSMASQMIAADRQQRRAASQLGIPAEVVDEYTDRMGRVEHMVPPDLKGTDKGATLAVMLAATLESWEEGKDLKTVLRKLSGENAPAAQPKAPPTKPALTPSQTGHTPNASPVSVRAANRSRAQSTIAGFSRDELDEINKLTSRNGVKI